MSAAIALHPPSSPPQGDRGGSDEQTQQLFQTTLRMGLALTDAGGSLADASTRLAEQTQAIKGVVAETQSMSAANRVVSEKLIATAARAQDIGETMARLTGTIAGSVAGARDNIANLASAANEIDVALMAASAQVGDLRKSSSGIQNIAREIQLLAVNAGVEAARHGISGRGFAVIAEAVKKLADQTRSATDQTDRHLVKLAATVEHLQGKGQANLASAREADGQTSRIADSVDQLLDTREAVKALVLEIDRNVPLVTSNAATCGTVLSHMQDSADRVSTASDEISAAVERVQRLGHLSEDMAAVLMASGVDLPISGLMALCSKGAAEIARKFEAAVKSGEINRDQLFDERYKPLPGTAPQQHVTDFTNFTDRVLPEIQEAILSADRRITFCAAADRNGYLPTHNRKFSQPQSEDLVWNTQHSRNRRIFNDRTGLASARNRKPLLLQTYRRDMGGGEFVTMNELAAPIIVDGRHWGGFRLAFRM